MPFRVPLSVRFGEVDSVGIVYYPRYAHYFHVAMEEYFRRHVGIDYPRLIAEHRLGLPTVRLETDFRRPLRYGDRLEVEVEVARIGTTSVEWRFRVFAGDAEPAAEARVVTVNADMDTLEKRPLPDWLRQKLAEPAAV